MLRRWRKDDLATDFICGMRESEESNVEVKWMVKEETSERFKKILIE